MKSNFEFLNRYWPVLAQLGANAENYLGNTVQFVAANSITRSRSNFGHPDSSVRRSWNLNQAVTEGRSARIRFARANSICS